MAETSLEKIYVSSPVSLYDKPLYEEYRQQIKQLYPGARIVWTKDLYRDSQDWRNQWPRYCKYATILIFITDEGWIGRGVHTEIEDMLIAGKRVYYFHEGQLLAVSSLQHDAGPVYFSEVTESWLNYCYVSVGEPRQAPADDSSRKPPQKKLSQKEQQRERENAKLKEYGFHWKRVGSPEHWRLLDKDGSPFSREDALNFCKDMDDWRSEEAMSKCPELSWEGYYSETVVEHPDIFTMSEEGVSYVFFPDETNVESIPEKPGWKRYTVPDGAIFIFDGHVLQSEQEMSIRP
jgi:hypothetical protein